MPWTIEGSDIDPYVEEVRDWKTLRLVFWATQAETQNTLRPLDDGSDQFELKENADGSYSTTDRSGGSALISVSPPSAKSNLRSETQYYVSKYSEELVATGSGHYNVTLDLVAPAPKDGGSHGTVSAASDEWHFAFADGEIATDRVRRRIMRGKKDIYGRRKITLTATLEEATVIEDSLNRQAASRLVNVKDGDNYATDENSNSRNTVNITPPTDRDPDRMIFESGDYVVLGWETTHINDVYAQVRLDLAPVSGPA